MRYHRNAGRRKPTRVERRELEKEYGLTSSPWKAAIFGTGSGRQWNRLRKGIQRAKRAAERDRRGVAR